MLGIVGALPERGEVGPGVESTETGGLLISKKRHRIRVAAKIMNNVKIHMLNTVLLQ